jgi:hypothetical protein
MLSKHQHSKDQLQLIFDLRRDVAHQRYRQTILCGRLDAFFNSLSSELVKSRCLTCNQPYAFSPAWPPPSNDDRNPSSSNV